MRAERRQRGFTLIETLVAFMILAMSLTVIFRIFSGGLRNVALSEDYAHAVMVAEAQLAATGINEPVQYGVTTGAWDTRFRWERAIEPYRPWEDNRTLAVPVQAYQVTISVDWEDAGRSRQITLSSVRLQPARRSGGPG